MKAAFLVKTGISKNAFQVQETPIPQIQEHEILVKVETFGLNYADVMARNGIYAAAPPLPSVLGYEAVGTIEKIGAKVRGFKKGDRVLAFTRFGAYAEYCVAHHETTSLLPAEVPNDIATALATQYCTGIYAASWMGNIKSFERVLIHAAAGGVGHALIQIAKKAGCEIIATAGSDEKIEYLKSLGVDLAINYNKEDYNTVLEEKFGPRPVDVIFDPIGGKNYKLNKKLLAVGGRLLLYGISSFSKKKGTKLDQLQLAIQFGILSPLEFLIQSNGVIGINMLHVADRSPHIIQKLMNEAIKGYLDGTFKPKIAFSGNVEELAHAHNLLEQRVTIGKLAVSWT